MNKLDWARVYAEMDKRILLKYQQLPRGEQIGKVTVAQAQRARGKS